MEITLALTLLVVVCTVYAEERYYIGQRSVSWTMRQQFCGGTLADLKWSICPNNHEDDVIPNEVKNKSFGKRIATDCCKAPGCTPLHVLEYYCVNPLRADTTKNLILYPYNNRPADLPLVIKVPPTTTPVFKPSTSTPSSVKTTTNDIHRSTTESLYWEEPQDNKHKQNCHCNTEHEGKEDQHRVQNVNSKNPAV